ncbi:tetratricopeptide repeat protein [Pedobacter cryoconitis]|uniref:Tetratricopeptide (TPR) repeat protein n=1 Tax=Pedobacter cryoconitis TaxID=188932 RepID=A0A7X0J308_9SPHI|nr:tetratricopeptide repeat protein [Pedobacter cryoconitis]MBB6498852.1 tetratricopeptide (TPR) repeat protein [Pedobacter cryoconitis]
MEILYNVDEKYLQAIEELSYGELPKALHLFNEIIDTDPNYARAHYQLGYCYFYEFKNYQTAGYHFKKCIELDPAFPDSYIDYLKLLVTLKMHKAISVTAEKAFLIPGVNLVELYELMGNHAEQQQDFIAAKEQYEKATLITTDQTAYGNFQEHIKRITAKQKSKEKVMYVYKEE